MNSYIRKKNVTWQKITLGIIGLILFIVMLNIFQSPIKNTFYYLTSPISKNLSGTGVNSSGFFAVFFNAKGISQENSNLKQENQQLLSQIALLQNTLSQDQAVQSAIQNTQGNSFALVAAQTIGLDTADDFILLDKGSQDGIKENMPVISSSKVLYGKVYKVYKNFSQVMLISNKNSVVDAQIQTDTLQSPTISPENPNTTSTTATATTSLPAVLVQSPIYGAVKGSGDLSVYLDLVASSAQINTGETLVTSGLEGIFPQNLLIGKITSVDKNDLKPFQTAQVQSLFDVKNIENLFIVTDYKQP